MGITNSSDARADNVQVIIVMINYQRCFERMSQPDPKKGTILDQHAILQRIRDACKIQGVGHGHV